MKFVIDTNVPIAANGRNTHACLACQIRCIELLEELANTKSKKILILDNLDLLLNEYKKHFNFKGQPGVGDYFYKYLNDHMYNEKNIEIVKITPNKNEDTGFDELPINKIDKSDRKLLAAALVSDADIVNALDSDWQEQIDFLKKIGIHIVEICPEHGK